jgi:iron complex outermembrane recepter protein
MDSFIIQSVKVLLRTPVFVCLVSGFSLEDASSQDFEAQAMTLESLVVRARSHDPGAPPVSPSTVNSLSAEMVRELEIITARQALVRMSNVAVSQAESARASSFSVRGGCEIPFHEFTGGRTGVGFYLDDIPCSDAYGRDLALFELERLSFYKGPHGTALGVPHSMGVIEAVTRPPGPNLRGDASYTHGSDQLNQARARVSGPIRSDLFFGLDGLFSHDDGWFEDRLTGDSYGRHERASGRLRLRWLPTDSLEFNLTLGLDHHDDDPVAYVPSDRTKDPYVLATSPDAYSRGGQNHQALQALWKADGWQLKTITSRREAEFDDSDDALLLEVFNPVSFPRLREQDVSTWTQEVRVESTDPDGDWRWRAGVFFSERDSSLSHFILGLGPWEGLNRARYLMDDYALYGELTRAFGDQLELTSGLRLQVTRDHTTSSFTPTGFAESLGGVIMEMQDRDDFSGVLPMAAAGWKWTEANRSYLRVSTGMQPGGLAIAAAGSVDYDTGSSLHYELGHDASYHDGDLRFHAAVFYTDYRDYQSFQFNPTGETIFNAERAHAYGVEGELRVRPLDGLEIYAAAGCTKARFDEFDTPVGDYGGNRINNIPLATFNLGGAYHAPWGGVARLDWRHVGDTWFDQGNTVKQGGYSLLDARIGYEKANYGMYLFARNLLDKEYYTHTYMIFGAPAATPGIPRVVGVELQARF